MPPPRTSLVARHRGNRDARLFVIATEGRRTEPDYLAALKLDGIIHPTRVVVEVVGAGTDDSAPEQVLRRLDAAVVRYGLQAGDERWLLLDVDRWGERKLADVVRQAGQKGYGVAVSNPCFEVWLLLHFAETAPATERCAEIAAALRSQRSGYSKSGVSAGWCTREDVLAAITRARTTDPQPSGRWPAPPSGTHAYKLFERLLTIGAPAR